MKERLLMRKTPFWAQSDDTHREIEGKLQGHSRECVIATISVCLSRACLTRQHSGVWYGRNWPDSVAASPPGPGQYQHRTTRWRPEPASQHMAHLRNGQRQEWTGWPYSFIRRRLRTGQASHGTDPRKACLDNHDQRHVPIPRGKAPNFVIFQTHVFARLKTFFNFPSGSDGFDHLRERRAQWSKDEVVGFFARVIHATTNQQKVLPIILPSMQHGHHGPIKASWSFGAMAHRDPLPILGLKRVCLGLSHGHAFAAFGGLYPHRFVTGHR